MKFFKQTKISNCQLIALQTVLSHYDKYPSESEISKQLPNHSFGNHLIELGIYLEESGIKTKIISNNSDILNNKLFTKSLSQYKQLGTFEDKITDELDIQSKSVIVNVNYYKIIDTKDERSLPHYVVLSSESDKLWLFDGANYNDKIQVDFENILEASVNINSYNHRGMWLVTL